MQTETNARFMKLIIMSVKISLSSSLAIYIAERIGLQFAASAGIIALLSVMTTKWGTVRLSLLRILTFFLSVGFSWIFYRNIQGKWLAYGLFIFFLVAISEWANVRNTMSVNAVISTHFLTTGNFTPAFVVNEFLLVLIGGFSAILFDLIQHNQLNRKKLLENILYTEKHFQMILDDLAGYLFQKTLKEDVWEDILTLEKKLAWFIEKAHDYKDNTFRAHPSYYIHYFEMRQMQCVILSNLHNELKELRSFPKQAETVAEFIMHIKEHLREMNDPKEQLGNLEMLLNRLGEEELPKTREEFESRAKLYHILMDIEEFLLLKRKFVEELDEEQLRIYWKTE